MKLNYDMYKFDQKIKNLKTYILAFEVFRFKKLLKN